MDELFRDRGVQLVFLQDCSFLRDAYAPCSHQYLKQRNVNIPFRQRVSIHATVVFPPHRRILCAHAGSDGLNVNCRASIVVTTRCLGAQMIVQALGISNQQNIRKVISAPDERAATMRPRFRDLAAHSTMLKRGLVSSSTNPRIHSRT